MAGRTFVGFGLGPIQAGIFLYEARKAGVFDRIVVAEVNAELVQAVRANGGCCQVNVASADCIRVHTIGGIEVYNPAEPSDLAQLVAAVTAADEMATALPSVRTYGAGKATDVSGIIAEGVRRKLQGGGPRTVLYAAENHNHAAELLMDLLQAAAGPSATKACQCLNTVVGKMSGVITDPEVMRDLALVPVTPASGRCFLVEEFNHILVSRISWQDHVRGISVFDEKDDLLPFEEAKLYGHNAAHALLGLLLSRKGAACISEVRRCPDILSCVEQAFLDESGRALCAQHAGVDRLFTPEGFREYALDLLGRMTNPFLHDTVDRVTRDLRRKLGWDDRLVGTMRLAMRHGIRAKRYAIGVAAALDLLAGGTATAPRDILHALCKDAPGATPGEIRQVEDLVMSCAHNPAPNRP